MSDIPQKPTNETAVNATPQDTRSPNQAGSDGPGLPASGHRLEMIHDLVRTGRYHVPASAIADRMIERMLAERHKHG